MKKKGEYEEPGFEFLRNASERELFYLNNGMTISGVRELVVQISYMDDDSFSCYVADNKNVFATWLEHIFKDKELGFSISKESSKEAIIGIVVDKICELELKKLKKFGIEVSKEKILQAEKYIQRRLGKGEPIFVIKKKLLDSGWSPNILDLILEDSTVFYKNFTSVQNLFEVNSAQKKFEELKKNIINAIAKGLSLKEIFDYLKNQGWSKNILDFIMLNVYKPHKNITKLSWFIIKEVGDKNKDISEVKDMLVKSGWKEYLVNHLIHRVKNYDDDLDQIMVHIDSFDSEEKKRIKEFLKSNGWDDSIIDHAIKNREVKYFWDHISESLNLKDNSVLKFNSDVFKDNIVKFKPSDGANDLWKEFISNYKKINISEFINSSGELHMNKDYIYYYPESDVNYLLELSKKGFFNKIVSGQGVAFYYLSPRSPIFCRINKSNFLIGSKIIEKNCISCKENFPITKMVKVEVWDASRTHKVTKYVCKPHEKIVNTLLDETRIVQ